MDNTEPKVKKDARSFVSRERIRSDDRRKISRILALLTASRDRARTVQEDGDAPPESVCGET